MTNLSGFLRYGFFGLLFLTSSLSAVPATQEPLSESFNDEEIVDQAVFAESVDDQKDQNDEERIEQAAHSYSSHPGAYSFLTNVSFFGDLIDLKDESRWSVSNGDSYKTQNWLLGDTIVIKQNTSWFSCYNYKMVNQNTGVTVAVNLIVSPSYNGVYTYWIVGFDDFNCRLILNDGSTWDISYHDYDAVKMKWLANDTIILGLNGNWDFSVNPNILINTRTGKYAKGACINKMNF